MLRCLNFYENLPILQRSCSFKLQIQNSVQGAAKFWLFFPVFKQSPGFSTYFFCKIPTKVLLQLKMTSLVKLYLIVRSKLYLKVKAARKYIHTK